MNSTNDVFQVLKVTGAPTITGAITALAAGHWGLYNAETNVAFDGATAANYPPTFYFAMNSGGKILKSAGQSIQKRGLWAGTKSIGSNATDAVLTLTPNGTVEKDKTYAIKIEFRGNNELYTRFGYNPAQKFFVADTGCEPTSPATEVLAQLYEAIANDPDHFMSVEVTGTLAVTQYDATSQAIGDLTSTQISELAALRAGSWTDEALVVTVHTLSELYSFCNINPKYFEMRQVQPIPSLADAECVWASFAVTTPMVYSKNWGYDIRELEYEAFGWNENIKGVYRQSGLHGLPLGSFNYQVADSELTTAFTTFAFQYRMYSEAGWKEYKNSASTIVVSTDGTAIGVLDSILTAWNSFV